MFDRGESLLADDGHVLDLANVGSGVREPFAWPVVLTRPGAHFRMVDVGPDGTVYALAVEPESASTSSATVLAIAPDSTVLWTATLVEP